MIVQIFAKDPDGNFEEVSMEVGGVGSKSNQAANTEVHRVEIPLVDPKDDQQYKIIILDAEDSFDVVVHYPDGDREVVWNLLK